MVDFLLYHLYTSGESAREREREPGLIVRITTKGSFLMASSLSDLSFCYEGRNKWKEKEKNKQMKKKNRKEKKKENQEKKRFECESPYMVVYIVIGIKYLLAKEGSYQGDA